MRKTALIIDDDRKAQSTFRSMFWRLAWSEPTQVRMGQEALAILKTQHTQFDVIILDQNLPVMKGLDFLIAARKQDYQLPPVIMITGNYDSTVVTQARELGVASLFMKNELSESKLRDALAQVLDEKNGTRNKPEPEG